jgi:LAO/AO transport system kinase
VLAPGLGDGVQAVKAGIIEIADVFAVNKADRDGAKDVARDLRAMQSLGGRHSEAGAWRPPIVPTVATTGAGIDELVIAIGKHRDWLVRHGELTRRRQARAAAEIEAIALATVRARLGGVHASAALAEAAREVADGRDDPYAAAERLLEQTAD